jgi:hypothetical protein
MMTSLDVYAGERPRRRVRRLYISDRKPSVLDLKLRRKAPPFPADDRYAAHFAKLDAIAVDRSLVGDNVDPPTQDALDCTRAVLHQLKTENLEPSKVVASVEGGVGICFVEGDKYADIECLNSGEILGVISNRRDNPTVWKIDPSAPGFAAAASRIRNFFSDSSTSNATE